MMSENKQHTIKINVFPCLPGTPQPGRASDAELPAAVGGAVGPWEGERDGIT